MDLEDIEQEEPPKKLLPEERKFEHAFIHANLQLLGLAGGEILCIRQGRVLLRRVRSTNGFKSWKPTLYIR